MTDKSLRATIEALWDNRDSLNSSTKGAPREVMAMPEVRRSYLGIGEAAA